MAPREADGFVGMLREPREGDVAVACADRAAILPEVFASRDPARHVVGMCDEPLGLLTRDVVTAEPERGVLDLADLAADEGRQTDRGVDEREVSTAVVRTGRQGPDDVLRRCGNRGDDFLEPQIARLHAEPPFA